MDRRSWPWKKKSSDKSEKATAAADSAGATSAAGGSQGEKDNYKKPSYVQISVESYAHLTGLEDQVKTFEDQVKTFEDQIQTLEDEINELNEKLSAAHSEITTKDNLVKQHAKVAEEAVSGWEKAEAEALALKNHLESVTLSKLTAEDKAEHLDGALKECMRQIRNLKEEHEQKLQEVVLTKAKQFDKMKHDLEAKIFSLDQELLRSAAENAAISRSLQERSNLLIKVNEEKAQAEAEIELLKANIESCEKDINSLKYELHIASKELEIRNEEKNMSMRSAEVANKQHMEGVKKIAKLEAECQRLRGLVRKKLPGPAALAQMKLEVENLGRDYGDSRVRRSPSRPPSSHMSSVSEFSLDGVHKFQKETEFLTERLSAMEEETKMLKEALANRNSELQASRNLCAKTASRLQSLEAQLHIGNPQRSPPKSIHTVGDGFPSQSGINPQSLTPASEEINDDNRSTDSWATTLIYDLSQSKKEKNPPSKAENVKHLDLMDDFLEMEKLACLNENLVTSSLDSPTQTTEAVDGDASGESSWGKDTPSARQHDSDTTLIPSSSEIDKSTVDSGSESDQPTLIKLRSRISLLLESVSHDPDVVKILDEVKRVVQDAHNMLHQNSAPSILCIAENSSMEEKNITVAEDDVVVTETANAMSEEMVSAVSKIHEFVISLGKEAMSVHDSSSDGSGLSQKLEEFSDTFSKVLSSDMCLVDFVFGLSNVLAKASELRFNVMGYKGAETDINGPDCIDKVALPENKVVQKDSPGERYENGCAHILSPTSNPEFPDDGNLVTVGAASCKVSLEEFEELKSEKENIAMDLARSTENLAMTKSQLQETEQLLAEVRAQLASAQKLNSLSETQLKCMAESYRSLEARAEDLETEVNLLRARIETVENELQSERKSHQDALTRYKELENQLQMSKSSSAADNDLKTKQDRELTAAAEKLAECQETIFLLGKQLKALHPRNEFGSSPNTERSRRDAESPEHGPTSSSMNLQGLIQSETEIITSPSMSRAGGESPVELYNLSNSPDTEASPLRSPLNSNYPKHGFSKSGSLSSSSTPTPEKHARGFTRFFSSKGRNVY